MFTTPTRTLIIGLCLAIMVVGDSIFWVRAARAPAPLRMTYVFSGIVFGFLIVLTSIYLIFIR